MYQLLLGFKKTYDSVISEVLYNIVIEFVITMKLKILTKKCLNETYRKFRIGKHFCVVVPIRNGFLKGDALSTLLSNFVLNYGIRWVNVNQDD